jgi:dihydropteroate synthase
MSVRSDCVLARDHMLELGGPRWLMGIVNASPDSFSDGGRFGALQAQRDLALAEEHRYER